MDRMLGGSAFQAGSGSTSNATRAAGLGETGAEEAVLGSRNSRVVKGGSRVGCAHWAR